MKTHVITWFLSAALIGCSTVFAQTDESIKVDNKTDINKLFVTGRWLMPDFQTATIFLKTTRSQAKMNYDLLSANMYFIDKKDTLALKNGKDVVMVQMDKRNFKNYNNAFVEVIARAASDNEIWVKRLIKKTDTQKEGAYGLPSSTSAVTNVNTLNVGASQNLSVAEWAKYKFTATYYITIGAKTRIANKPGFLKAYSKKKDEIESFIKTENIDFDLEDDIVKLFKFCTQN